MKYIHLYNCYITKNDKRKHEVILVTAIKMEDSRGVCKIEVLKELMDYPSFR